MARTMICPDCGESDDLRGAETANGIEIQCGGCGRHWMRDEQPERCATCGGSDLVKRSRALTQYSRGTQLSIVGVGDILLCRACDSQMAEWCESNRAVPPGYRAAAETKRAAEDEDEGGPVLMTP